jgi:transcriptional regulator with XRE-family HTH domain
MGRTALGPSRSLPEFGEVIPDRSPLKYLRRRVILLREYREAAGLSQQELADLAGVQRESISRLETGRRAPQNNKAQRRIAAALGIDISQVAPEIEEDDGVYWQVEQRGCMTRSKPYYPDEGWAAE